MADITTSTTYTLAVGDRLRVTPSSGAKCYVRPSVSIAGSTGVSTLVNKPGIAVTFGPYPNAGTVTIDPEGGAVDVDAITAAAAASPLRPVYATESGALVDADQAPVSGGALGTFASTGALETAFPAAANTGKTAMVGSAAPYAQYVSNGTAWVASSGGASSWSGLSDKATANLPVENAPLAAALAAASSGGNTTGYQVLNGMAKPVSLSQFFDAAVNRQARILLTGTSIAGFDWSAVKILAQRLGSKYGVAGTVEHLGVYGGTYGPSGGYAKQSFGGSGGWRMVITSANAAFTRTGYGNRCIVVYSKDGGSTATASVDGGTAQTIDCSGAQAYNQELIFDLATVGQHSLTINPPASGSIYIERLEWIDTTRNGIIIEDACVGGSGLRHYVTLRSDANGGNVAGIAISGNNGLDAMFARTGATKPDVIVMQHFTNDDNTTTYETALTYACQKTAVSMLPFVLLTEQPAVSFLSDTTPAVLEVQKTGVRNAILAAGSTYGHVRVIDWIAMVDYTNKAAYTAKYYFSGDLTHPAEIGHTLPRGPLLDLFGLDARATSATAEQELRDLDQCPALPLSVVSDPWGQRPAVAGSSRLLTFAGRSAISVCIGQARDVVSGRYLSVFAAPHAIDATDTANSTASNLQIAASGTSDAFGKYVAGGTVRIRPLQSTYDFSAQPYYTVVVLARRTDATSANWLSTSPSNPTANRPKFVISGYETGLDTIADARRADAKPLLMMAQLRTDPAYPAANAIVTVPGNYRVYAAWIVSGQFPAIPLGEADSTPFGAPPLRLTSEYTAGQIQPGFAYVEQVGAAYIQKVATRGFVARPLESNAITPVFQMLDRGGDNFRLMLPSGYTGGTDGYDSSAGGGIVAGAGGNVTYKLASVFTAFPWSTKYTFLFRVGRAGGLGLRLRIYNAGNNGEINLTTGGTWQTGNTNFVASSLALGTIAVTVTFPAQSDFSIGTNPEIQLILPASAGVAYATCAIGGSACI